MRGRVWWKMHGAFQLSQKMIQGGSHFGWCPLRNWQVEEDGWHRQIKKTPVGFIFLCFWISVYVCVITGKSSAPRCIMNVWSALQFTIIIIIIISVWLAWQTAVMSIPLSMKPPATPGFTHWQLQGDSRVCFDCKSLEVFFGWAWRKCEAVHVLEVFLKIILTCIGTRKSVKISVDLDT